MALLESFTGAYRAERATARPRKHRKPLLTHVGRALGRLLPTWDAVRAFTLSVGGLAAFTAGAFQFATSTGWIALGLSLLVLEYLTGGGER